MKHAYFMVSLLLLATLALPVHATIPDLKNKQTIAQKCTGKLRHLKNCLASKEPCSKSDFALLGISMVLLYNCILGIRLAMYYDIKAAYEEDEENIWKERCYQIMEATITYDPASLSLIMGNKLFHSLFNS